MNNRRKTYQILLKIFSHSTQYSSNLNVFTHQITVYVSFIIKIYRKVDGKSILSLCYFLSSTVLQNILRIFMKQSTLNAVYIFKCVSCVLLILYIVHYLKPVYCRTRSFFGNMQFYVFMYVRHFN